MENPSVVMTPAGIFIIEGNNDYYYDYYGDESDPMWFLPTGSTIWEEGPSLPTQISVERHCAVQVGDDSFLLIGGKYETSAGTLIVEFDIGKNRWDRLWGNLNVARMDHACANLENRKIIVAGGYADSCVTDSTEVIDIASKTVRKVLPLPEKKSKLGMATIGTAENIQVLVFGGYEKSIHVWNDTTEAWEGYGGQTRNNVCLGVALRSEIICRAGN